MELWEDVEHELGQMGSFWIRPGIVGYHHLAIDGYHRYYKGEKNMKYMFVCIYVQNAVFLKV